jgi:hypothetical protein
VPRDALRFYVFAVPVDLEGAVPTEVEGGPYSGARRVFQSSALIAAG